MLQMPFTKYLLTLLSFATLLLILISAYHSSILRDFADFSRCEHDLIGIYSILQIKSSSPSPVNAPYVVSGDPFITIELFRQKL